MFVDEMHRSFMEKSQSYRETIIFHEKLQNIVSWGPHAVVLFYKQQNGTYNIYFMRSSTFSLEVEFKMVEQGEQFFLKNLNKYPKQDFSCMNVNQGAIDPIFAIYREKYSPRYSDENHISAKEYFVGNVNKEDTWPRRVSLFYGENTLPKKVKADNKKYVDDGCGEVNFEHMRERYNTPAEYIYYDSYVKDIVKAQIEDKSSNNYLYMIPNEPLPLLKA